MTANDDTDDLMLCGCQIDQAVEHGHREGCAAWKVMRAVEDAHDRLLDQLAFEPVVGRYGPAGDGARVEVLNGGRGPWRMYNSAGEMVWTTDTQ